MGVINAIIYTLLTTLITAFLLTGTFFFVEATVLISKLGDIFGKVGAIAIPVGGASKKPPITGSNSTPV